MVTGFLTSKQGVAGWVYFQTDPIHLGFEPWRQGGGDGERPVMQNWDVQHLGCDSADRSIASAIAEKRLPILLSRRGTRNACFTGTRTILAVLSAGYPETGFEEIKTQGTFDKTSLHRTGLIGS